MLHVLDKEVVDPPVVLRLPAACVNETMNENTWKQRSETTTNANTETQRTLREEHILRQHHSDGVVRHSG